jgi:hypothetical protein
MAEGPRTSPKRLVVGIAAGVGLGLAYSLVSRALGSG